MKIKPKTITFKVSEASIFPTVEGKILPGEPIDVVIDPPFPGYIFERLVKSKTIEVEDGKLVGFEALIFFEEQEEWIYERWKIEGGEWTVDYVTPY